MAKVEFVDVKADTKRKYSPSDMLEFTLTLKCNEPIEEDLEFEAVFFGDARCDEYDQKIGSFEIGPLEKGEQFFTIETNPIDLTRIPIKTLFGLTTVLLVGKYKGKQFLRVGYIVNVSYPGVSEDQLLDSEDKQAIEGASEEGSEELEIMNDDELDEESGEDDEEAGEDGSMEEDDEETDAGEDDEEELVDDESGGSGARESAETGEDGSMEEDEGDLSGEQEMGEDQEAEAGLQDMLAEALGRKGRSEPIPLETPIKADVEEFEYKGHKMKKSDIEMTLMEKPIVHVYDIDWSAGKAEPEIVESSSDDESQPKRAKHDDTCHEPMEE